MDESCLGYEVDLSLLKKASELDFKKFTVDMLQFTCILSGCGYLESIKGMDFK